MNIELIETNDGSHSLYLPELNETYHSRKGAITESLHVYIKTGLNLIENKDIRILEFGFGTGLNALLSANYALLKSKNIHYFSTEKFPLPEEIYSKLNYGNKDDTIWNQLHQCEWNKNIKISECFELFKFHGDFVAIELPSNSIDLIYYDAFAPSKQPEVWTKPYLEMAYRVLKQGAFMVSYCAQGQFKRDLKELGFSVESVEGPPGKMEMVRAQKPDN